MSGLRILFLGGLMVILHLAIPAQDQSLIFHQLNIQDGLSQATNAFIYKDTKGFVWISSIAGLNRFDGIGVKIYSPDKSDPSSILGENIQSNFYEDDNGGLWFSTFEGINKYNWDQDCFDHYQVVDASGVPVTGYHVFHLDHDSYLWFILNNEEIYTFHIPTGTFHKAGEIRNGAVRCFVSQNAAGQVSRLMLLGRNWPGIDVAEIGADRKITSVHPLSDSPAVNVSGIQKTITEGDSVVWIISPLSFLRYSMLTGQEKGTPVPQGRGMIRQSDSTFLFATLNDGLLEFNINTWAFQRDTLSLTLASKQQPEKITYLNQDRDGTIWLSTNGVGIRYAHPEMSKFQTIRFEDYIDGPNNIIPVSIFEDHPGRLVCFTKLDGVYKINFDHNHVMIQPYTALHLPDRADVNSAEKDFQGRYWISTFQGVLLFSPADSSMSHVTDSTLIGLTACTLSDGSVVFASPQKGLHRGSVTETGDILFGLIENVPQNAWYSPVLKDGNGRIWAHQLLRDFMVYDPTSFQLLANIPLNGFPYSICTSADRTTHWIASSTGLYEIDNASFQIRNVYNTNSGFPVSSTYSMLKDDQEKLWLGHSNGLVSFDVRNGITRSYTYENGLSANEYTQAACRSSDGTFWFGSNNGITRFNPLRIRDHRVLSIPQITDLNINDRAPGNHISCVRTGATNLPVIQQLCLDYQNNTISFTLHALEYGAPRSNSLRYTMEGLDNGFVEAENGSIVRYPSMPPGDYRFVLYASNADEVENPDARVLLITILPPYYRTWWFITLSALGILMIFGYIIYLRFSKRLELQNVRLKLYENLHDDVGSRLTAIVLSAEDLERNEHLDHPKIKSISQVAKSIVSNMRRLVWAIDPENDRLNNIIQKINHDKSLILGEEIDFRIEVDERLKNQVVPGEIRYQMSSISNEAFTNIVKYANATKVTVRISKENKHLKLVVQDNGIGFTPDNKEKNQVTGSGYGLANMHRRASRVGGTLSIRSTPGEGSVIEFLIPFKG